MAWAQLDINRPHLVYIILGAYTSLFMLCSSFIKERLYIGEATVATLVGIVFGPHAANLINPLDWGNTDQITLEFCRVVLVVQCFAVGVELPRHYMERHWKSVLVLLVPVMTFGWIITSLFIWWMFSGHLDWLDSLCIAACVTATDPVLASSVVGKGKFAKRVPKHLRDLLSAESGCNDGMAFPFIYLALYLIRYRPHAAEVTFHWVCYTILYECIFGAVFGVLIGYFARRLIKYAHEKDMIDRESFLVFYFVLALFCAGSGSLLGMDDLLIGFACGVGFSNDGWFQEKTEETHVSNVIDLLLNLTFFVYFGTIIPWSSFNSDLIGTAPWRLIVVAIFVLFFRRIPIMVLMKPLIPDIKTWRESLFAGHFGPIGVGALFVAILARAELETETTTPLADLPEPGFEHLNIIELIWPITTFLVLCSIIVHGSSVAVFTLGRHINTLSLTMSFTQANEDGPTWMDRLPRIQSRSKSSMSMRRPDDSDDEYDEKTGAGGLPAVGGIPGNFLRRQKEDDHGSRSSSTKPSKRRRWDDGIGPGGPVSQSAITPSRRQSNGPEGANAVDSETSQSSSKHVSPEGDDDKREKRSKTKSPQEEIYFEGDDAIVEDHDGNVLKVIHSGHGKSGKHHSKHGKERGSERDTTGDDNGEGAAVAYDEATSPLDEMRKSTSNVMEAAEHPVTAWHNMTKGFGGFRGLKRRDTHESTPENENRKRGPALAYQFGNTIIVEDEDGEVLKKYDIPSSKPVAASDSANAPSRARQSLVRMGTYLGMNQNEAEAGPSDAQPKETPTEDADKNVRFTISSGGRRMSKMEFIEEIQRLDPKSRAKLVENSDAPEALKREVRQEVREHYARNDKPEPQRQKVTSAAIKKVARHEDKPKGPDGLALIDSDDEEIPFHPVSDDLARFRFGKASGMTAAQRRRQRVSSSGDIRSNENDNEASRGEQHRGSELARTTTATRVQSAAQYNDEPETAAERRRREQALGHEGNAADSSSDTSSDDGDGPGDGFREPDKLIRTQSRASRAAEASVQAPAQVHKPRGRSPPLQEAATSSAPAPARQSIRFAETPTPSRPTSSSGLGGGSQSQPHRSRFRRSMEGARNKVSESKK